MYSAVAWLFDYIVHFSRFLQAHRGPLLSEFIWRRVMIETNQNLDIAMIKIEK